MAESPAAFPEQVRPPKAPLVLRIGVVGHRPDPTEKKRPNPDVPAIQRKLQNVLQQIRGAAVKVATDHATLFRPAEGSRKQLTLRIVSALAEGSDQWAAQEALDLEYELQSPLPFARAEYARDFAGDALANFQRLLSRSSAILELDGDRDESARSYEAAGRIVIAQSDLLIAIWDGQKEQGVGGSGQMIREALARRIPVIRIPWSGSDPCSFYPPKLDRDAKPLDLAGNGALLDRTIHELLLPPVPGRPAPGEKRGDLREAYFAETVPEPSNLAPWWKRFRDLFAGRARWEPGAPKPPSKTFREVTEEDWNAGWTLASRGRSRRRPMRTPLPPAATSWVNEALLDHYAWANQLSIHYGNLYRSAFLLAFLAGAAAISAAVGTLLSETRPVGALILTMAELFLLIGIVVLIRRGRKNRWHERWIDYRTLAERLRQARFFMLLGGGGQQVSIPAHLTTYGDPASTWMHWHYRSIERAAGLMTASLSSTYLAACRETIDEALLRDQHAYHAQTSSILHRVDHNLHRIGDWLFLTTGVLCLAHLAHLVASMISQPEHSQHEHSWWSALLVALCAILPTFGGAFAAIRSQAEFHRVSRRSYAMQKRLRQIHRDLMTIAPLPDKLASVRMRQTLGHSMQVMIDEVLDWRIVFQDRPLVWPA